MLEALGYPAPKRSLITYVTFQKSSKLEDQKMVSFTHEGSTVDEQGLTEYFRALKSGEYFMDSISQKITGDKYKEVRMMNYASFADTFDVDQDKIILFYNSKTCKNFGELIKNVDSALGYLKQSGVNHVFGGYFDTSENSSFGLYLDKKGDFFRYYKKGFHDMEDFGEVDTDSVQTIEDVLSFVMDMSSVHIDIDYEDDL